ncbi:cysteine-rich/transmembrane domain A-like protein [Perilla frutescens var. hirtella]|uniref:Cysteine-rich/transmembrane domain A-like protein n=1 Tax=Perilla frutescens var. hirtella TaxID=608512 RepID=A0AAD4IKQ7_PERFH|nr:cysteine-rich/transmembrane domain A-like protein [Perilla frutescens var. hirtella]
MAEYDQSPPTSYPAESYKGPYVMAPPPIGYPTRDGTTSASASTPAAAETTSRGGGFLKGCLAGLCCCWCLDCCF